jgi:hypothetical protein
MSALVCSLLVARTVTAQPAPVPEAEGSEPAGYTAPEATQPVFRVSGYVDFGWAKAQGNGSSFLPGDTRLPADYYVDPFAPAVNSRGDVASLDAGGRFVNGFLPYTVGAGGNGTFLLNVANVDLQVTPRGTPVLVFIRAQALPRWNGQGSETRFLLDQAFGQVTPLPSQELSITAGLFDSVFGIGYLENQSNLRVGITPSLIARYTTGHAIGLKVFYRWQIPSILSAVSINAAVTNHGFEWDSLQVNSLSFTGVPVGSARLGYELNLLGTVVKLGVSGLYGPRNDQRDPSATETQLGADARFVWGPVALWGEYVNVRQEPGTSPPKFTGTGVYSIASGFRVYGFYVQAAYALPIHGRVLSGLAVYGRYGRRKGGFDGTPQLLTSRWTVGARLELWTVLALKAEALFNRENAGAPTVDNDVFTTSAVFSF